MVRRYKVSQVFKPAAWKIIENGRVTLYGVTAIIALLYTAWAFYDFGTGSLHHVGAGMFPALVGSTTAVSCIAGLLGELRSGQDEGTDRSELAGVRKSALFTGVLAGYVLSISVLGILLSSVIASILCTRILARISWIKSCIFGLSITVAIYLFFSQIVGAFLPSGNLWDLW